MIDVLMTMPVDGVAAGVRDVASVAMSAAHGVGEVMAASGGVWGWIKDQLGQMTDVARLVIALLAVVIVIWGSKMGGWSLPAILISGLTAGLFYWFGTHITTTSGKVDQEFQNGRAMGVVVTGPVVPGGSSV